MPFTALTTRAVGGNISRADVGAVIDNISWLRAVSSVRVYTVETGETIIDTLKVLDWTPSGGAWHPEWSVDGGVASTTFTDATGGLYVNVGDVEEGIWIAGAMIAVEAGVTGYASPRGRRLQMQRGNGTTFTEMAEVIGSNDPYAKRWSEALVGLGAFTTSTDQVRVRGNENPYADGPHDVLRDRRWALRLGSNVDGYAVNFVPARPVSDTNIEQIQWWNDIRSNLYRIERRPSAQRWKTANTAITANVSTAVPLGETDWSTDPDMAPGSGSTSIIEIQQLGLYLVTGQVTTDQSAGTGRAEVFVARDGGNTLAYANIPDSPAASTFDTAVACQDIAVLSAGADVELYARASANTNVLSGRGTHLTATLLSSDAGTSTGRQEFAQLPAPATWPQVASMSSARCPHGTMRVVSDLVDRLWHRPAFKASLSEDQIEVETNAGWTDIPCEVPEIDYTNLESTHGYTVFSGGSLMLPWPGLWLCGAFLQFSPRSADGPNRGNQGHRGMRLATGRGAAAHPLIVKAMNVSTQGWARTICEPVVINGSDVELKLQGMVGGPDDDANRFGAVPVLNAHLWAVEIGENVTRDPRP